MKFTQEQTVSKDGNIKLKQPFPSPTSNTPGIEITHVKFPQVENRQLKRKRSQNEATALLLFPSKNDFGHRLHDLTRSSTHLNIERRNFAGRTNTLNQRVI
ncbi:hypothetical protein BTUL_0275g00170 [Botrytis tulipae]|uniref:Uncharacterized protein n=1 Tax=Botrytis tulipae TaxID=87230 RepID=A0A4Z1E5R8_9HELO|nr:hypothetical protein BTUL_0275g00170 [Botrytis tulipae]